MSKLSKWSNVIRGAALGDAWGDTLERREYSRILTAYGKQGMDLPEGVLTITDDTQMSLYLARALNGSSSDTGNALKDQVIAAWVKWEQDPENFRAPGETCLRSIRRMRDGFPWQHSTVSESDGSGALMRAWAAAFLPENRWAGVAMWQAATTHGAPNAIVSSVIAAHMVRFGYPNGNALGEVERLCQDFSWVDHRHLRWIYGLGGMNDSRNVDGFLRRGRAGVLEAAHKARITAEHLGDDPWNGDVSERNPGWRAHDALVCAALCLDLFPDDPAQAVRRAVNTDGDSDTIGTVTGALAAVNHPFPWKGIPEDWFTRLEPQYQDWILESDSYSFE